MSENHDLSSKVKKLREIEKNVNEMWYSSGIYEADPDLNKPKKLVTFPYPYMNGSLHVGHGLTATRVDAYARFMRLKGYNVLFPWAWHWTGEPIMGSAKRVKQGDQKIIDTLVKLDGVPESAIPMFADPYYFAQYFTQEGRNVVKEMGFSVDWRREFTTASNEGYSRFITWQYLTLREKGYITQGTHPVVWCPNDKSPTGDHDRAEGEGVSPEELFLLKFPLKDGDAQPTYIVAATFRPETIFGATNIWVLPDGVYTLAAVDGERWVVSEYATTVLAEQKHDVKQISKLFGKELVGRLAINPFTNAELPILPAGFVDPSFGTGVVYSVPAHAPYDYAALRDIQRLDDSALIAQGLNPEMVRSIAPISIIRVEGYGDYPAIEVCDSLGIKSQKDKKLELATQKVYQAEYSKGIMKDNCGKYSGTRVSDAKKLVFQDLRSVGYAALYYELPSPVVCRCGTRCIVKILENQWFLRYGDADWKSKAKLCIDRMGVYPPESRQWFLEVVEWLQNKPCARRSGLGTPLPWDKEWIVETLSDSTVYMAYYIVSKYVNSKAVSPASLTLEFFDYVFYGRGDPSTVARVTGVPESTLRNVREEFLYWYPVDLRTSAKELIPNHLTFFIFHHVALFPEEHWPKAVSTNGMLTLEGQPMHKSKGHFVSLKQAISEYGADATRLTLLNGTENLNDPDWNRAAATNAVHKIDSLLELVEHVASNQANGSVDDGDIDRWLLARLKEKAKLVQEHMSEMRTRSALNVALFEVWEDYRRYLKRTTNFNNEAIRRFFKWWMILLHPFIPHVAQWCYIKLGGSGFVEHAGYPPTELSDDEVFLLAREEYIRRVEEDLVNLQRLMPDSKLAEVVVADGEKIELAKKLIPLLQGSEGVTPQLVEVAAKELGDKKKASNYIQRFTRSLSEWRGYDKRTISRIIEQEASTLKAAINYLQEACGIEIRLVSVDDASDKKRAENATPLKPAITFLKN
ncbi:MAG: leucine--tRNA ligase [Thermoprotei archaeon]